MAIRDKRRNTVPPDGKYRFPPGVSANPGGRSSAAAEMARRIREQTGDGLELIGFALAVLRGVPLPVPKGTPADAIPAPVPTDAKSRMFALDWLSERGWGKAKQDLDIVLGTYELTDEQRAMLDALRMSPHERRERIAEIKKRLLTTSAGVDPATVPDDDDDA